MDAVRRVLQELERQAQAEAERRNEAFQQAEAAKQPPKGQAKRKKQKKQPDPGQVQTPDDGMTKVEAIPTSAGATVGVDIRTSVWNRQRVLDALSLTIALGPPPGLNDDW